MYRPTVQIPVTAKNANGTSFLPNSAGIVMLAAHSETAITPLNGTLSRFTRRQIVHPGIARSRENAYQVREALVSPAAPQNSCPTVAITNTSFAAHRSIELVKIVPTKPAESLTSFTSVAANRNASSRNHPITAQYKTARQNAQRG